MPDSTLDRKFAIDNATWLLNFFDHPDKEKTARVDLPGTLPYRLRCLQHFYGKPDDDYTPDRRSRSVSRIDGQEDIALGFPTHWVADPKHAIVARDRVNEYTASWVTNDAYVAWLEDYFEASRTPKPKKSTQGGYISSASSSSSPSVSREPSVAPAQKKTIEQAKKTARGQKVKEKLIQAQKNPKIFQPDTPLQSVEGSDKAKMVDQPPPNGHNAGDPQPPAQGFSQDQQQFLAQLIADTVKTALKDQQARDKRPERPDSRQGRAPRQSRSRGRRSQSRGRRQSRNGDHDQVQTQILLTLQAQQEALTNLLQQQNANQDRHGDRRSRERRSRGSAGRNDSRMDGRRGRGHSDQRSRSIDAERRGREVVRYEDNGRSFKPNEVGLFDPYLDASFGEGPLVTVQGTMYYRDIFSFIQSLEIAVEAGTWTARTLRYNIHLCLRGQARMWFDQAVDPVTRAYVREGNGVDRWKETLLRRFKPSMHSAHRALANEYYNIDSVRAGRQPSEYVLTVSRLNKQCGVQDGFNVLHDAWMRIHWSLRRDVNAPTEDSTPNSFIASMEEKFLNWREMAEELDEYKNSGPQKYNSGKPQSSQSSNSRPGKAIDAARGQYDNSARERGQRSNDGRKFASNNPYNKQIGYDAPKNRGKEGDRPRSQAQSQQKPRYDPGNKAASHFTTAGTQDEGQDRADGENDSEQDEADASSTIDAASRSSSPNGHPAAPA